MGFSVVTLMDGPGAVVTVAGEVDLATAPDLRTSLETLLDDGVTEIVVDLVEVSFMDSTGLGTLARAHYRASQLGGRVRLHSPQPNVVTALEFTGLDQVLKRS